MSALRIIGVLTISASVAGFIGCGQKEEQTPPSTNDLQQSMEKTATDMQKQAEAETKAVEKTAAEAQQTGGAAATAEANKAQGMVDEAKKLVEAKKYADALNVLKGLSNMKLTPEQQKLVDDLKSMIQKQMADDAASSATKTIGDALGGSR